MNYQVHLETVAMYAPSIVALLFTLGAAHDLDGYVDLCDFLRCTDDVLHGYVQMQVIVTLATTPAPDDPCNAELQGRAVVATSAGVRVTVISLNSALPDLTFVAEYGRGRTRYRSFWGGCAPIAGYNHTQALAVVIAACVSDDTPVFQAQPSNTLGVLTIAVGRCISHISVRFRVVSACGDLLVDSRVNSPQTVSRGFACHIADGTRFAGLVATLRRIAKQCLASWSVVEQWLSAAAATVIAALLTRLLLLLLLRRR